MITHFYLSLKKAQKKLNLTTGLLQFELHIRIKNLFSLQPKDIHSTRMHEYEIEWRMS